MTRSALFTVVQGAVALAVGVFWESSWAALAVWCLTFGVDAVRRGMP